MQLSEAKAKLSQFLDQVERGETVVIKRHGKPIAHIAPASDLARERAVKGLEGTREMRKTAKHWSLEEILKARHEDHNR